MNPDPGIDYRGATAASPRGKSLRAALLVAVSLAGGFALARLWPDSSRVPSVPAVCSYLLVSPREPIFGVDQSDASGQKDAAFLATQRVLVTSPEVIAEALRSPEIAGLAVIKSQADPEVWLRDKVHVEHLEDTRLFRVSMSSGEPAQQAAIINAITKAYLQKVQTWRDDDFGQRIETLASAERDLKKQIERLRNALGEAMTQSKGPIDLEALRDELAFTQEIAKPIRMAKMGLEFEAGQSPRIKLIAKAKVSPTR